MKKFVREASPVEMLNAFQQKKQELESQTIESSEYIEDVEEWELKKTKEVYDFDGFLTNYSLWYNPEKDLWVTIFGDNDVYNPTNTDFDMEFESEDEAYDWFYDYGEDDIDEEW